MIWEKKFETSKKDGATLDCTAVNLTSLIVPQRGYMVGTIHVRYYWAGASAENSYLGALGVASGF